LYGYYLIVCVLKQYADHTDKPKMKGTMTPVPVVRVYDEEEE